MPFPSNLFPISLHLPLSRVSCPLSCPFLTPAPLRHQAGWLELWCHFVPGFESTLSLLLPCP